MAKKSSRLSKNLERRSKRNLILSIIGIVVILFVLIRYGIPFLADFSFFVGQIPAKKDTVKNTNNSFVSPPTLDPLPIATKNSKITVTGNALSNENVVLYLNGSKYEEKAVDDSGSFSFTVSLTEGDNILKAKAISGDTESDFSDSQTISYKKEPPKLEIDNPSDGQTVSDQNLEVRGKTDAGSSVTVNGFVAVTSGEDFSYTLQLKSGDNDITVDATDDAGNKTEKKIKVTYTP